MRKAYTSYISSEFLPAFFFLCLCLQTNAQNTARWVDRQITIDGIASEWQETDLVKENKGNFNYLLIHDSSAFYIVLLLKDEISQAKFLNAGFSIFLNSEGKEKRSSGIDFPLRNGELDVGNPGRPMDLKNAILIGLLNAKEYELSGFKEGNGKYKIQDANKEDIRVAIGLTDSLFLYYEVMIPYNAIFRKQVSFNEIYQKNIAVCFSFHAITRPSATPPEPVSNPTAAGPPRRGRNASPGNNPYGVSNQPSQNFGQMEKLFQSSKTWKIINLAKPT